MHSRVALQAELQCISRHPDQNDGRDQGEATNHLQVLILKQAGYQTNFTGKWHLYPCRSTRACPQTFFRWKSPRRIGTTLEAETTHAGKLGG